MNDRVKIIRDGREHDVPLPDGIDFDLDRMQARIVGRTIVLEPRPEADAIAPGFYTKDTLPPLSEGALKILASIDAVAPLKDVRSSFKSAEAGEEDDLIDLDDDGIEAVVPTDEPLPGIDPDR